MTAASTERGAPELAPVAPIGGPGGLDEQGSSGSVGFFLRAIGAALLPVVVAVLLVVVLWIAFLEVFGIDPLIGKTPWAVAQWLFTDPGAHANRATLWGSLRITLRDAALGYLIGLAFATFVSVVFVLFRSVEQAFLPIALLLRSVPLVAMAPIIILIAGRGLGGVAVIGAIVVLFPALVNITLGLRSVHRGTRDLVTAYGGSDLTVLRKVGFPTALPAFFASARISVPTALIGALLAEWLSTGKGVGGDILSAIGGFDYAQVWALIVAVTGVSVVLYSVVGVVESLVLARFGPDAGRQ